MDVKTGKIYDFKNMSDEEMKKLLSELGRFPKGTLIEIDESDLTELEKKEKQVDINGNSKASGYAKAHRDLRKFVESKNKNKK